MSRQIIIFLGLYANLLIGHTAQASVGLETYYGQGMGSKFQGASSLGVQFYLTRDFWQWQDWTLGPSTLVGAQSDAVLKQDQGQQRLQTLNSRYIVAGLQLTRKIAQSKIYFNAHFGPSQTNFRINDSSPNSTYIIEKSKLNGQFSQLKVGYQAPLTEKVYWQGGLSWNQNRFSLKGEKFRTFEQTFDSKKLSLTEGIQARRSLDLDDHIRYLSLALNIGIFIQF